MPRYTIIEFLLEQKEYLLDNQLLYATFCFFEKNYESSILELNKKKDDLYVYHTNSKQVYSKKYSFSMLEKTILGLFFGSKNNIKLKYNDLEKGYLDPYYLKEIMNIKFNTLHIIPIYEEEVLGYALFYFKNEVNEINDLNKKLISLMKKINKQEINNLNELVNSHILKQETYYILSTLKENSNSNTNSNTISVTNYYCNNSLKEYLNVENNIFTPNTNLVIKKIKKITTHPLTTKIDIDEYTCWYLRKDDLKGINLDIEVLTLDNINYYQEEEFTLIYLYNEENINSIIPELNKTLLKLFPSVNTKYYQVSKNSLVLIIDILLTQIDQMNFIKEIKNQQIIFVDSKKHLSKNQNLVNVVKYLDEIKPIEYNKEEYLMYFRKLNSISANADLEYLEKKQCYNVKNIENNSIGTLITLPPRGSLTISMYDNYQKSLEKNLNKYIDKYQNLIITILTSSFKRKKIFEIIKKLQIKNNNLYVIIHQNINDEKLLGEGIVKLRNMGVKVIIDSSIYMDLKLAHYTNIIEGIYVKEEEYDKLIKYPDLFGYQIIEYFNNLDKIILIEKNKIKFTTKNYYFIENK